jgi:RimJ/RimL family protein N-acetyltransferase
MEKDLFRGQLVRLGSESPEAWAKAFSRWARDVEYMRLLDSDPARLRSEKTIREWMEKELLERKEWTAYFFAIRTLKEDQLIGFVGLNSIQWHHGDAWVGIGIGEREYWGKGYGTDAMRLILRYAFTELNLYRVSLGVFEYNPRALRSYQKAGFVVEGRVRQALLRDGRRWDWIVMGILREEWEQQGQTSLDQSNWD